MNGVDRTMLEQSQLTAGEAREPLKPQSHETNSQMENCRDLQPVPLSFGYKFAKRLIDIVGGILLILILSPVFLVLMILVKVTSRGPIFYKSTRIGLLGNPFVFIKFRSMRPNADKLLADLANQNEKDGPIFKMKDDPRITPIGRALRRYSLDELPQLWSVVTGDMSLVGPRPPLPHEVLQYDADCLERLRVKPGITCYWQVKGRSRLTFQQWMELDRQYIHDMSFLTDLKIICMTPAAVFRSDGAY